MVAQPKKILVVDDEDLIKQALLDRLIKEGFRAVGAKNGAEGLTAAQLEQPNLILLDLDMPVMDGSEMLRRLRAEPWGKEIPIIILTNVNDNRDIAESLEQGVFGYLMKTDWHLDEVVAKIKEKVGNP